MELGALRKMLRVACSRGKLLEIGSGNECREPSEPEDDFVL